MLEAFDIAARAIADPGRLRILRMLADSELCVCQITAVLDLAPATVSKHLSILKNAGLVFSRKAGRWVHYRLADQPVSPHTLPLLQLVAAQLHDDSTIIADRKRLAEITAIPVEALCQEGK